MAMSNNSRSSYVKNKAPVSYSMSALDKVTRHLISLESPFIEASQWNPVLSFAKESVFAKNIINNSDYLTGIAMKNAKSFEVAFLQLATSGLSLDPALKQAYLVPRGQRVVLDVSYIGLSKMATDEGLCRDIVVEPVFEHDTFRSNGRRSSPEHQFDPFGDKGPLILTESEAKTDKPGDRGYLRGVYVDYGMNDGRNLVYFITKEELAAARSVSESWKKALEDGFKTKKTPWKDFPWAMVRKTAIKQTIHLIPGNRSRVATVIDYLNRDGGEGMRDSNVISHQAARYEMDARLAANKHEGESTSNVPLSNENITPEVEAQVTAESSSKSQNESSSDNIAETASQNSQQESDNAEIGNIRETCKKRVLNLVKRVERNFAYDTMIGEVKTAFEFNDDEIAFAIRSLEQSRRTMLQNKIVTAISTCNFVDIDSFIAGLSDSEFKQKSGVFVESIKAETHLLRQMFNEAVETKDFTDVEKKVNEVEFDPLKQVLLAKIAESRTA